MLVTGSTDGIGREAARLLGEKGARVLVHGRTREKAERAVAALREETGRDAFEAVAGRLRAAGRGARARGRRRRAPSADRCARQQRRHLRAEARGRGGRIRAHARGEPPGAVRADASLAGALGGGGAHRLRLVERASQRRASTSTIRSRARVERLRRLRRLEADERADRVRARAPPRAARHHRQRDAPRRHRHQAPAQRLRQRGGGADCKAAPPARSSSPAIPRSTASPAATSTRRASRTRRRSPTIARSNSASTK